ATCSKRDEVTSAGRRDAAELPGDEPEQRVTQKRYGVGRQHGFDVELEAAEILRAQRRHATVRLARYFDSERRRLWPARKESVVETDRLAASEQVDGHLYALQRRIRRLYLHAQAVTQDLVPEAH